MFISRLKSLSQKTAGNYPPQPPLVAWTNHMSVEVKLLDNDHKKLLILLNELHYAVFHRQARQILDSVMDRLIKQIRVHFAHEEQFFTETAYPGAVAHEREHTRLIEHARIQQQRFRNCTDVESCLQVVEMLKNCLFNHIEREDRQYVPHFKAREMGAILAANEAPPAAVQRIRAIGSRIMQGAW